jgi:hypothetical protein
LQNSAKITVHHVYLPILEFKREKFPDDVNPRSHEELSGRVPRLIEESAAKNPEQFHLLNRGILILADNCTYLNHAQSLEILISDPSRQGLADGATTDRVLANMTQPAALKRLGLSEEDVLKALDRGKVHLEIISGDYEAILVALAGARNTSVQVKEFALENLDGRFEWIKGVIENSPIRGRVRYRENDPERVDVRTVLALMTLFHPKWTEDGKEPVTAYSSKGGILTYFRDDEWQPGYRKLAPVLIDILRLYDHIHVHFPDLYLKFKKETKNSGGRFGKRREINYKPKSPERLDLTGAETHYVVPDGWLYPTLASLRVLLDFSSGDASWKTDPFQYFLDYGHEIVEDVVEESESMGFNPQTVGKKRKVWSDLRTKVELQLSKMGLS